LQRREELCVDQGWLRVLELMSNITGKAEIRILIDGAGNQARDIGAGAKDGRETVGK